MAESRLDMIINARGAMEAIHQVTAGMGRLATATQRAVARLDSGFTRVKNSIFSLNTVIAGIAITGVASDIVQTARAMDTMERSLRGVMTSSGAARLEFERLRKIADQFQLPDEQVVEGFRLMAANHIPNAEKAIKTLSNVALDANKDLDQVVQGIVRINPRALQQLGVESVELATGNIVLGFRGIRREVLNTDDVIRRTLLEMFEEAIPDQSKRMANSVDFQFKRMVSSWDSFKKAILDAGLEDFLAATFKVIADSFEGDTMEEKARSVAKGIQQTLFTLARDVAWVLDMLTPLGSLIFSTINHALSAFNKLPPSVQSLGIIGFLYFGTVGKVVLVTALALMDAIGVKLEHTEEWINRAKGLGVDLVGGTPIGMLIKKGVEAKTGKKMPDAFVNRPDLMAEVGPQNLTFGTPEDQTGDKRSFSEIVEGKIAAIEKQTKAEETLREAQKAAAAEAAKNGKDATGQVQETIDKNKEALDGELKRLKLETERIQKSEASKRDQFAVPERLEAEAKAEEFINGLKEKKLQVEEEVAEKFREQFQLQGEAIRLTRVFNEETEINNQATQRRNQFLEDSTNILRDALDATDALGQEEGVNRREAEIKAEMLRRIERERITIDDKVLKLLQEMPKALAEQERINANILYQESRRKQHLEDIGRLQDEIKDLEQERPVGQSLESQLNAARRDADRNNVDFDEEKERARIIQRMGLERKRDIKSTVADMEKELNVQRDQLATFGLSRKEREVQLRLRQEEEELRLRGRRLDADERQMLEEKIRAIQDNADQIKVGESVQRFVDSFEVGWDKIVDSGEQAYSHLEDALVKFVQTGKLEFDDFANYITQELIRLGIRASINQLIGGGSSGGGGLLSGLFNTGGGGGGGGGGSFFDMFKGPGFGAANSSGGGGGNFSGGGGGIGFDVTDWNQRGGIVDYYGKIPGFQRGGINRNQRLISVSEGHTPEAIIPLRGGKVPVEVKGGKGVTISAPISIITPDAQGVRRSVQQMQAELSSTLARASRRIN